MRRFYILILAIALMGCAVRDNSNAWGNFEANEIILSARVPGNITQFPVREGSTVKQGDLIAMIDPTDLILSRDELLSNIKLIDLKIKAAEEKNALSLTEKENLEIEQDRFRKLTIANAASQKQLDDIDAALRLLTDKLRLSATEIQMARAEKTVALKKLDSLNNNIEKCSIKAPINATVLATYAVANEFTATGKPIVKLADVSTLKAVFYITETQLTSLKTGQEIKVRVDGQTSLQTYPATVTYISDKAEFTPKVIQTREERVKLVYRVEADCGNDGSLKLGMPVEIIF
jgi:HlyD family secretion protein